MLKNYLKIAFRSLLKHRSIAFINIFGLSIGFAVCLLILLFVRDEISYDRYNAQAASIYRVVKDFVNDDGSRLPDATTPPALAPAMQREIPEVEHVTRIFPGWGNKFLMRYGDKRFIEEKVFRVDSSFFDVFSFPFVEGDAHSAFKELNSILITASTAKKYFGDADPMHKVISTDFGEMMVTGVLKDVPEASHIHFDFLISVRKFSGNIDGRWGWYNFYTYVKLKPNVQVAGLTPKIQALYKKNDKDGKNIFYTQALTDIHLGSDLKWEIGPNGNILYVYAFSIIGLFVIAIACINYINLSTAKSALRAKEIGIRKVSGAFRGLLVRQFLMESIVTVLIAFLLGVFLARVALPAINVLVQKNLSLDILLTPLWLLGALAAIVVVGLIAGLYPALYLSAIKPVWVLKGVKLTEAGSVFSLRKVLVVFQFTISISLIVGTGIVLQQIHYIQNARLGLNKDQVMIISDAGNLSRSRRESLLHEFVAMKGIDKAATCNGVVGGQNWTTNMKLKGSVNGQLVNFLDISYDYLDVLGITIKEGRNFSAEFSADTASDGAPGTKERLTGGVILNEKAVKDLGISEPAIGKLVSTGTDGDTTYYLKIVGVARDFHFASFKSEIKPFAFMLNNGWQDNFTIKVSAAGLLNTIADLQKKWTVYSPDRPFRYSFLDDTFSKLYKSDQRFNQVLLYLTILAIAIGCLGLFGLTAFMIERRTREIGIRKVVGASAGSIVVLLSGDFVKLVLLAILIASPIAWYAMDRWLQNFAYRVRIEWWIYILAGALAVLIALATIGAQAIKAALTNPVKSLRAD
jgi:putative ABC transport system permease protein